MTPFFHRNVRIEWGQCDPAGIVYAPRYLDICGESTMQLFEHAGFAKKKQMLEEFNLAGFPMVDVSARFFKPAAYGDDVVVETAAPEFGNSSFKIHHRIMLGGDICMECTETRVWTVPDNDRPSGLRAMRVPEGVREKFLKN